MTIVIDKEGGDVLLVVDVQNDFCPGGRLPIVMTIHLNGVPA